MHEFLSHIDNKEIFIKILHFAIDYLVENKSDEHTLRYYHKYGFLSPDDFRSAIRSIAQSYRKHCLEGQATEAELLAEYADLSADLQRLVPAVLAARKPEIMGYLIRRQNAQDCPYVESFDWDVRYIMGDSSFAQNMRPITTVTLNCADAENKKSVVHVQMDKVRLKEFIAVVEEALGDSSQVESDNIVK